MNRDILKRIKFRETRRKKTGGSGTPLGKTRKKLKSYAEAPRKFTKIFTKTASHLRKIKKIEEEHGQLSQKGLHAHILAWAREILGVIDIDVSIKGQLPDESRPVLFVGNHVSYIDIPLLMASVPVVFVSKAEVSKWLVIGPASKRAGTVFVKRESTSSRHRTVQAITDCLLERKQSLAIFPAGTTSINESKPWKPGALKIAARHKIPVQPFRLTYEPLRKVAFIDDDILPTHLWSLLAHGDRVKAVLEFGEPIFINDPVQDCEKIWHWTQGAHAEPTKPSGQRSEKKSILPWKRRSKKDNP
ncbi:MAG: lysophospholipid acyltransferase family protein [Proteobacteria bacterium]|nr:lysophospholipid acyltransferase family protein [Pseudomonadota bacterium]